MSNELYSSELKEDITDLLHQWREGDEVAGQRLLDLLYPQLRKLARFEISYERDDITLQATELVHELYLKLSSYAQADWKSRAHFMAISARVMRRILIDHARKKCAQKRLDPSDQTPGRPQAEQGHHELAEWLALDDALQALMKSHSEAAKVVELRHFGGLTIEETAEVLKIGRTKTIALWRFARAWLLSAMDGGPVLDG